MAGIKRGPDVDLSPRPWKIRRVGSGSSDVFQAMALHLEAADEAKVENESPEPGLRFLNASADAVSAFDWSELVGALDLQDIWNAVRADDENLFVDVPGAVRRVTISRRLILKEIVDNLGLKVFSYGIVLEPGDVNRGWLDMEIPSSRFSCAKGRKKFFSDDTFSKYDAMESACDAAISYLRSACFVLVQDISYEEMRSLQNRALAAETWSNLLNDALEGGKNDNKAIHDAYASFLLEAKGLCKDFADVFGAGTIGMASTSATPGNEKVYYGGPRPPITRVEQLAFSLVELINRSGDVPMLANAVV